MRVCFYKSVYACVWEGGTVCGGAVGTLKPDVSLPHCVGGNAAVQPFKMWTSSVVYLLESCKECNLCHLFQL